jgi:hypothetical protein
MAVVTADMSISLDGFISGPKHLDEGIYRVQRWIGEALAWREQQGIEGGEQDRDSEICAEKVDQNWRLCNGSRNVRPRRRAMR